MKKKFIGIIILLLLITNIYQIVNNIKLNECISSVTINSIYTTDVLVDNLAECMDKNDTDGINKIKMALQNVRFNLVEINGVKKSEALDNFIKIFERINNDEFSREQLIEINNRLSKIGKEIYSFQKESKIMNKINNKNSEIYKCFEELANL